MAKNKFQTQDGLEVIGDGIVSGNLTVYVDIVANTITAANVVVTDTLTYGYADAPVGNNLVPETDGLTLGNTTNRWDGHFGNVLIYNTKYLKPQSNGVSLGDADQRWLTYSTDVNASGDLTVGGGATITGDLTVTGNADIGTLTVSSLQTNTVGIYGNVSSITTTAETIIDSFALANHHACKYVVYVEDGGGGNVHSTEILVIHNDTDAFKTEYGTVYNTNLGTFDAHANGVSGNFELTYTSVGASGANTHTVHVLRTGLII